MSTQTVYIADHHPCATRAQAERIATQRGVEVQEITVAEGERVGISWHGHQKTATVVGFKGGKIVARFVARAGTAPVERAIPVSEIRSFGPVKV